MIDAVVAGIEGLIQIGIDVSKLLSPEEARKLLGSVAVVLAAGADKVNAAIAAVQAAFDEERARLVDAEKGHT
jgi:4'-phosphopantetheinyl transferase EntD